MPTFLGFTAILLWSLLALFTAASGPVPPFQLAAMTFAIGTLVGLVDLWRKQTPWSVFRQPIKVWALGIFGLFGYHFFYFTALKNAPPVEAGLIAYLWPLLIVVASGLLPGEHLRWYHVGGAILGVTGCVLIVTKGQGFTLDPEFAFGYGAALLCALLWSGYSVLSRRFANVPTDCVTGFCAATAILAALCHMALETTVIPQTGAEWLAIIALGLGPVGLAFYTWDIGMKHGNIQLLGVASYAAPLLSTLILIAFGFGEFTIYVAAATFMITGGALLAAKDILKRKSR